MCCVVGSICIVSTDFLTVFTANTTVKIGVLPNCLKPLGYISNDQTGADGIAYIAPLRFRGGDYTYGQLMVSNSGEIFAYTSNSGSDYAYYYGQLAFPVTRS